MKYTRPESLFLMYHLLGSFLHSISKENVKSKCLGLIHMLPQYSNQIEMWGTWLAQSVGHVTFDLRILNSNPKLGVELTKKNSMLDRDITSIFFLLITAAKRPRTFLGSIYIYENISRHCHLVCVCVCVHTRVCIGIYTGQRSA